MTMTPAGWYPDPENTGQNRWWDGAAWTEQRSAPYALDTTTNLQAPEGTPWNTGWIWLVIVLPLLPMLGMFTINWSTFFDLSDPTGMSAMAAVVSPGYLFTQLGGFVVYGLSVWFSYLDRRVLTQRGVPRPFHWAWAFLSSIVYVIGRSVVVKRRTGHGMAPLWAAVASLVISFGVGTYLVVVMFSAMAEQLATIPGLTN